MLQSLARLPQLPADARVCCAHEYTLSSLNFARAVDPENTARAAYEQACLRLREQGLPTLPANLGQERLINPFLRSRRHACS